MVHRLRDTSGRLAAMVGDRLRQAEGAGVIGAGTKFCWRRAAAEREIAATATLAKARNRALVSAKRRDKLAQRAERVQTGAAERLSR